MALLIAILKIIVLSSSTKLNYTNSNENKLDKASDISLSSSKINNRIPNLSSIIKKMSFEAGIFTFRASLVFIQLKKTFIKTLILYHFDLKCHF